MIAGKERLLDGVAGVVVVPGGGGQGQDALQDPDQDVGRGGAAGYVLGAPVLAQAQGRRIAIQPLTI